MNKFYFLFLLTLLIGFKTTAQQYDFTIIDNSDFENILKYKVKNCLTYKVNATSETRDSGIVNASYYNQKDLSQQKLSTTFPIQIGFGH